MTRLYAEKRRIPTADCNTFSSLPPIAFDIELKGIGNEFLLDEDDGLFINYGRINGVFPYRYQDGYCRELSETEYQAAVLENGSGNSKIYISGR